MAGSLSEIHQVSLKFFHFVHLGKGWVLLVKSEVSGARRPDNKQVMA